MKSSIRIDVNDKNIPVISIRVFYETDDLRDKMISRFIQDGGWPESYLLLKVMPGGDRYTDYEIAQIPITEFPKHLDNIKQLANGAKSYVSVSSE